MRLSAGEKFAADHLWIGLEQAQAISVSILSEQILAKIRKRRFEWDVSGKGLIRSTHERIEQVVAGSIEIAKADQFTATELFRIAAHRVITRVLLRQAHCIPDLQRGAGNAVATRYVILIRAIVVEKIELDELDALVLEIDTRTIDPSAVAAEVRSDASGSRRHAACVARSPVIGPVDVRP